MMWCGENCIVIVLKKKIYMVGPGELHKLDYRKGCFCIPEIDGVRIITNKKNEMLRILPNSYTNIFRLLSSEPAALLYQAWESFENRDPLEDLDIR